jgi:hypothetical protein
MTSNTGWLIRKRKWATTLEIVETPVEPSNELDLLRRENAQLKKRIKQIEYKCARLENNCRLFGDCAKGDFVYCSTGCGTYWMTKDEMYDLGELCNSRKHVICCYCVAEATEFKDLVCCLDCRPSKNPNKFPRSKRVKQEMERYGIRDVDSESFSDGTWSQNNQNSEEE